MTRNLERKNILQSGSGSGSKHSLGTRNMSMMLHGQDRLDNMLTGGRKVERAGARRLQRGQTEQIWRDVENGLFTGHPDDGAILHFVTLASKANWSRESIQEVAAGIKAKDRGVLDLIVSLTASSRK